MESKVAALGQTPRTRFHELISFHGVKESSSTPRISP